MGPITLRLPAVAWALVVVVAGAAIAACALARDIPPGDTGEHPPGWLDPSSGSFHAKYLRATGDDLDTCQQCHGTDYRGGAVSVACTTSGCHTHPGGPEWCGTCHGGGTGPRPTTGAHAKHLAYCDTCHVVPTNIRDKGHITGHVTVTFSGAALYAGAKPAFDAATMTCTGAYCHGDTAQTWHEVTPSTPCDACHGNPPSSHARWARVAKPGTCSLCHPVPSTDDTGGLAQTPASATHLNGTVDLNPTIACDTCHGQGPDGAPPPSLAGSSDPTVRGAGAHRAHLDPTFPDRMGHVAACTDCHTVPASVTEPGHLGTGPNATVTLVGGGTYDAVAGTCVVTCHWNRSPGPAWTDDSGDAIACDACHGFPPVLTRVGTVHTACQPTLSACVACHPFGPTTHVDGLVELLP